MLASNFWRKFWNNEDGIGTLELLLIVAVLVVIAIAFRKWIIRWVTDLFDSTDKNVTNTDGLDPNKISPK